MNLTEVASIDARADLQIVKWDFDPFMPNVTPVAESAITTSATASTFFGLVLIDSSPNARNPSCWTYKFRLRQAISSVTRRSLPKWSIELGSGFPTLVRPAPEIEEEYCGTLQVNVFGWNADVN